ncbi:MAG: hypothetical protein AAGF51_07315 [Pseudomonadota bacterium]
MMDAILDPWIWFTVAFVLGATMVWLFKRCQTAEADARRMADGEALTLPGDADPPAPLAVSAPLPADTSALEKQITDLETQNQNLQALLEQAESEALDLATAAAEAAADAPPPSAFASEVDFSEVGESGLRYRSWLLGRRLETVVAAGRSGGAVDWDLAETDLAKALAVPIVTQEKEETEAPSALPEDRTDALKAEVDDLQRELSRIRFQNWKDAGSKDDKEDSDALALTTAQAQAATLRSRVATLETSLGDLRAGDGATGAIVAPEHASIDTAAAIDDANALRAKLAQSEAALRAFRAGGQDTAPVDVAAVAAPVAGAAALLAAVQDDAASLRHRLAQAETALRQQRTETPATVETVVTPPVADGAGLQTLRTENASLRSRLWTSEWRINELRQAREAAGDGAQTDATTEELDKAKAETATLKSRLWTAEAQVRELTEAAQGFSGALVEAEGDPRAAAQIETLRQRLAEFEALQSAQTEGDTGQLRQERDALRARLSLAESEVERLRAGGASRAQSFAGVADSLTVDDGSIVPSTAATPDVRRVADPDMSGGPVSGAEAAALELIQSDAFSANEDNRPLSLLAEPNAGEPDDLKLIQGVGPRLEVLLNELGVFYFSQIAAFSPADFAWIDRRLSFDGRVIRDRWLPQTQALAQQKLDGGLRLGPDGAWTDPSGASDDGVDDPSTEPTPAAAPEALDGSPGAIAITAPLSGAEAAALEMSEAGAPNQIVGARPATLLHAPARGDADDLTLLTGVGARLASRMNALGVFYFDQIAGFGPGGLAWLDSSLGLKGEGVRARWAPQALQLADSAPRAAEPIAYSPVAPAQPPVAPAPLAPAFTPAPAQPIRDEGDRNVLNPIEDEALRLLEAGFSIESAPRPSSLLEAATQGPADDLKKIKGVGPKLEALLNDLGLFYYKQIAEFSAADVAWLDTKLRFNGRIVRDRWVAQATLLSQNGANG